MLQAELDNYQCVAIEISAVTQDEILIGLIMTGQSFNRKLIFNLILCI